jgi:hypothetical protein
MWLLSCNFGTEHCRKACEFKFSPHYGLERTADKNGAVLLAFSVIVGGGIATACILKQRKC